MDVRFRSPLIGLSQLSRRLPGSRGHLYVQRRIILRQNIFFTFYFSSGASADCKTAFFVPDDNQVQVQCQENDVRLLDLLLI